MIKNLKIVRIFGPAVLLAVILAMSFTACAKNPAVTTTVPPIITSAAVTSPGTPAASSAQQRQSITGNLSIIKGNTLTISTVQGKQVNVTQNASTLIQKMISITVSDLKQGELITAAGTSDSSGNLTASSILVRQAGQAQGQGQAFSGPGALSSGGGRGTSGTISGIQGNTLTVTTAQGAQTAVTISANTTIEEIANASATDLKTGLTLTITGSADAGGNITAGDIVILQRNQPAITSTPASSSPQVTRTPVATLPASSPAIAPKSAISTDIPFQPISGTSASSGGTPLILITSPLNVSTIPAGDVTITAVVSNINLVNKIGQTNVNGEGHVVYYMDVTPRIVQGQSALTAQNTYQESAATSYTWHNVGAGYHYFTVVLVNNDSTYISPTNIFTVYVTVQGTT